MEKEEVDLIKRIQGGDNMAFHAIMNKYGSRVMNVAYSFAKNTQDAEDLYQETFIRVFRNIKSFRFESEFYTWIYRILTNLAYNQFKKKGRMQVVDPGENDYLWETIPGDKEDEADVQTYKSAFKEEVDNALLQLSSQQRTVFILKHYEGKKIKDIAAILDCTEGTIKRYLFRATRKLQDLLHVA